MTFNLLRSWVCNRSEAYTRKQAKRNILTFQPILSRYSIISGIAKSLSLPPLRRIAFNDRRIGLQSIEGCNRIFIRTASSLQSGHYPTSSSQIDPATLLRDRLYLPSKHANQGHLYYSSVASRLMSRRKHQAVVGHSQKFKLTVSFSRVNDCFRSS